MKNPGLVEKVALVHFLLMFGYKIFSIYLPLYLIERGFSILEVGYTSFMIYLSIALFAPLVGYLNHKIKPSSLIVIGVIGYAAYSLLMLMSCSGITFYLAQILLGISGAFFFVSSRVLLMGNKVEKKDSAFAWFYSAPSYADAIAPAVGALLIWKVGFAGAFSAALAVQITASIYALLSLRKEESDKFQEATTTECLERYKKVGNGMRLDGVGFQIFISFLVLLIVGFNNTFFLLFLKDLGWAQDQILAFNSVINFLFLPVSFWIAKNIDKRKSVENIISGGRIVGLFSVLLGAMSGVLNAFFVGTVVMSKNIGNLVTNSGRSGLMGAKMKDHPEEAAAIDTIFSPLSTALGSLLGAFLIYYLGYPWIFVIFGGIIVGATFFARK